MLANLENIKEKKCVFCGVQTTNRTARTCGNPLCVKGWTDYKLFERNKTSNCESARVSYIFGDRKITCKKNNFKGKANWAGYAYDYVFKSGTDVCKDCEDWQPMETEGTNDK